MEIKLDSYHSCSKCGQKAGSIRAVGKYVVELYPHETEEEFQLLCISCKKEELRLDKRVYGDLEEPKKTVHFFEGLMNVYRKAFQVKDRNIG